MFEHDEFSVTDLEVTNRGVQVVVGGRRLQLSWVWLRDHATDGESFHSSTSQRMVPLSVAVRADHGDAAIVDGGAALRVDWPDGGETLLDADLLATIDHATTSTGVVASPWTGIELAERLEPIRYADIVTDDGRWTALQRLWRDGIVTVADVPTDLGATRTVIEQFGYVRTTIFGDVWQFSSDGGYDDTASTNLEIPPHTDGTYSHDAPGLLGLHCHLYDATGGDNVFVDAHAVVARLAPAHRRTLETVEIPGQYIGDGVHLMAQRPVVRRARGQFVQVSYNHHDRAPMLLPAPTMSELYAALASFDDLINEPELQFELALRPGDMVLVDNWRLLHGRRAFTGHRLMAGGYVNREEVESTTRLAAAHRGWRRGRPLSGTGG